MRKISLILAVLLLAAPAWAAVTITATDEGAGVVAINYVSDANVSAFALDITVDAGVISAISDYHVGESTSDAKGYGIFPGTIEIIDGDVNDYGTPDADPNDHPDTQPGLDSNGITIEMGALYEDGNQPPLSGLLCKVTVTENCELCIAGNTTRGSVVLEDANEAATNLPVCISVTLDCFPSDHPDYDEWVAVGKPDCWCYPRQCHGDADGGKEGSPKAGYWYVGAPDLSIFVTAYLVKEPPKGPGIASIPNGICCDFAHDQEGSPKAGYWRVGATDLSRFVAYYLVKEPPKGPGVPGDCGGTLEP